MGGWGTNDTVLIAVGNLLENPARWHTQISKLDSRDLFDRLSQSLESKHARTSRNVLASRS